MAKMTREERAARRKEIAEFVLVKGNSVKKAQQKYSMSGPGIHNALKEYRGEKGTTKGESATLRKERARRSAGHFDLTLTLLVPAQRFKQGGDQERLVGYSWKMEALYELLHKEGFQVVKREFGAFTLDNSEAAIVEEITPNTDKKTTPLYKKYYDEWQEIEEAKKLPDSLKELQGLI